MDAKIEVVVLSVADVDRAKDFYAALGWRLDADITVGDSFRVVQFTPPGSPASIHVGKGISDAPAGSARAYLVVDDVEAAKRELDSHGAAVSDVFHREGSPDPVSGPDPARGSYQSFATFSDPDGNTWVIQEITNRLPGRIDSATASYASVADLAAAMRRAEAAHGKHEAETGERDADWPTWYAGYMISEQRGEPLPS